MTTAKSATLHDIARIAKCSLNTASLAIKDSSRISERRRREIQKIANELNYIPNHSARNMRAKRTRIVGIYTLPLYDAVRAEMANTLIEELHAEGYKTMLGIASGKEKWYQSSWMKSFQEMRVEVIVILWQEPEILPEWAKKIPVIFIGCSSKGHPECDYLALDRKEAGRMGAEHLVSRGYKNVLVATSAHNRFTEGCLEILKKAGALCNKVYSIPDDNEQFYSLGYSISQSNEMPDAVICGDSHAAAKFMQGVLESGKKIPDDIAIVGYDYFPLADVLAVPLTTVEQPLELIASRAASLIKQRLKEPEFPKIHIIQPHRLVVRKSS